MKAVSNFLDEIVRRRHDRVDRLKVERPMSDLLRLACVRREHSPSFALSTAIQSRKNGFAVIAEIKRASPSQGDIRPELQPAEVALAFEQGGATAISVLTEEDYFRGALDDLRAVKTIVSLPVLRKDFIIDEYQVHEAAEAGADALLLIVAALDDPQLAQLRRITEEELLMDALVEVHTAEELRRAVACGARLIGVNNRDLRSFTVSLGVSEELASLAPADVVLVSESGLRTKADLMRLSSLGFQGFLVGEWLMRSEDPAATLRELVSKAGVS